MNPSSSSGGLPSDHRKPPPAGPAMGYPYPAPNPIPTPPTAANGNAASFGVSYPYPAPPPHPQPYNHYPPYHYPPPPPPPPPTFLRRLLAVAVAGLLLLGAATFIVWLLLRPRPPAFSLTSLTVSNLSLTSSASLSTSFSAALLASNPNSKLSVSYFTPLASVSLATSPPLAVTSLPPFSQPPRNTTAITFRLAVDGAYVNPDDAAALERGGGVVNFQVRVEAVAVFARGGWRTRRRVVRVLCNDVPVPLRGRRNATELAFHGPPRPCFVGL